MDIEGSGVAVGIDAAVVANHHVVVRRPRPGRPGDVVANFVVPPTLAGMDTLSKRLSPHGPLMAVAEPTSMTWLPLSIALGRAGCSLALVGNRHSARLRSALAGKNKSDPIDADMLCRAGEFFSLEPARIPGAAELALKRVCQRRGKLIVDSNRCLRRVISLARWAFPDVWNAFAGSRPTALAVLTRWPDLSQLARARTSSVSDVIAAHTRDVSNVDERAANVRAAARAWAEFWDGHVDLDALAWETAELLDDYAAAEARLDRATDAARQRWEQIWGDDELLLSVPGMGPIIAPTVRAFLADCRHFDDAKQAQSFVGLNPSNWSSGQMQAPSRAITKEGPQRAPPRLLPGRQRRPRHRSTVRRVLSTVDDRTRALPHPSQLRGRPQARCSHLGDADLGPQLPAARPRRTTDHPTRGQTARRRAGSPRRCPPAGTSPLSSNTPSPPHPLTKSATPETTTSPYRPPTTGQPVAPAHHNKKRQSSLDNR
jgi:transposase